MLAMVNDILTITGTKNKGRRMEKFRNKKVRKIFPNILSK